MVDKDYSLTALNQFCDHASDKGLLKKNTAQSRKAAANKVFSILDASEASDLRNIDVDAVFDRFQNLQGMQYKPDSLQVYLSRTKTALADFIAFVDNPSGFKSSAANRMKPSPKTEKTNKIQPVNSASPERDAEQHEAKHLAVPVPLREGLIVKIMNLPADLSASEAERLAAIIKAYAIPERS